MSRIRLSVSVSIPREVVSTIVHQPPAKLTCKSDARRGRATARHRHRASGSRARIRHRHNRTERKDGAAHALLRRNVSRVASC